MMNLKITIGPMDCFDEDTKTFFTLPEKVFLLEHSLVSISLWEERWHKNFISDKEKTRMETMDYVRCMAEAAMNEEMDTRYLIGLTSDQTSKINTYIDDSHTATNVKADNTGINREIITSELIYYWMFASKIPIQAEHWPLNRLLQLIKICGIKNKPPKKMSKAALAARNRNLNKARREALGTTG